MRRHGAWMAKSVNEEILKKVDELIAEIKRSSDFQNYKYLTEKLEKNSTIKTKVQEIKQLQKEITKREYYHQDTSEQVQKWNKEVETLQQIPLYQDWITTQEKLNQYCQEIKSQLESCFDFNQEKES
mgnify:FL=1